MLGNWPDRICCMMDCLVEELWTPCRGIVKNERILEIEEGG